MLYIETDIAPYEKIKQSLATIYPSVKIEHIVTDSQLSLLGFSERTPCIFSLEMTRSEFYEMMDDLSQLETDAFNTPNGAPPSPSDTCYQKYLKYGWLWDMFSTAERMGKITKK